MKIRNVLGVASAAALATGLLVGVACSTTTTPQAATTGVLRSDLPRNKSPAVSAADYQSLIDDNSAFAFDLYARLSDGNDKNIVYSPLSASVGLAMAYAGARGETATQMAKALHFTLPDGTLHLAFDKLTLELASRNIASHTTEVGDKSVELSLVNGLWADKTLDVVPAFLDTLATNYDAGVRVLDFTNSEAARSAINGWVSDQTHGKITDLLRAGDITPSTRAVLTDALYFRASWDHTFDKNDTSPATFHTLSQGDVSVPTMGASENLEYMKGDGYVAADLSYDGGKLAMRIVLPDAGRFDEVQSALSLDWMKNVDQSMQSGPAFVSLPRFDFSWGTTSLKKPLQALGMTDAFGSADFSGMTPEPIHIQDVLQKATLSVDESGSEASAATAITFKDGGAMMNPFQLDVNRPFLFFIRDQSGTLLFMGQVTNPAS